MVLYNARTKQFVDDSTMWGRGESRLETFANASYNFTHIDNLHEFFFTTKVKVKDVLLECYIQPYCMGDFRITKLIKNEETRKAYVEFTVVNLFKPYNIEEEDYIPLDIEKAVLDPSTDSLIYYFRKLDTV